MDEEVLAIGPTRGQLGGQATNEASRDSGVFDKIHGRGLTVSRPVPLPGANNFGLGGQ